MMQKILFLVLFTLFNQVYALGLDQSFPYGEKPQGDVCVNGDQYATPETLLGSWAMLKAVESDIQTKVLPPQFTSSQDVVYGVGTAAVGNLIGLPNCAGGCNALNGFCFALKFNNKAESPRYMIFQSINIGANNNSFDIYMAGGGAGAFPQYCAKFWGENTANWDAHIENFHSCEAYFNYTNIKSNYALTYEGRTWTAKETLINACEFASRTGFNKQNFANVSVVPVSCPQSLTQITGLRLTEEIKSVGNRKIIPLHELSDDDFYHNQFVVQETTQMQDCKTPSSGYCHNVSNAVPDYQASISADLTKPLLTGQPASGSYCQQHAGLAGYCSWNNGESSGSDYCNQSESQCKSCGNTPKWCVCENGQFVQCR